MAGRLPSGPTVIYDDDHYYMANTIAELLCQKGIPVTYLTTNPIVASWGTNTAEQTRIQRRLLDLGVKIEVNMELKGFNGIKASAMCLYSQQTKEFEAENLVMVTARQPVDNLYQSLESSRQADSDFPIKSITQIGDCYAPAIIASAVFAGHRYARELDSKVNRDQPMKFDRVFFDG